MQNDRKLILYIAMSLDGYIAKQDDDISFLTAVEQEGEDYGYSKFIETIDVVINPEKPGRQTYLLRWRSRNCSSVASGGLDR